jgi:hypothetical protein
MAALAASLGSKNKTRASSWGAAPEAPVPACRLVVFNKPQIIFQDVWQGQG